MTGFASRQCSHQQQARCSKQPTHFRTPVRVAKQRGRLAPVCLTSPRHEHRRELERRPALALSCAERSAAADGVNNLVGLVSPAAPGHRLRVAVDVDEVLGRFVYTLNRFCKEAYGMDHGVHDYWIYEFAKIWHCSQERSNEIVHEFFKSRHFVEGIPVIPGAYESLERLSTIADLVVVTSRQHVIQDVTLDWLDRHFPGLFTEVYFGNHFALQGTSRKKSDICKSIGAHVLIDDNPGYAADCASAGIQVLLYDWDDSYPWSKLQSWQQHPNIQVVRNWQEAEHALSLMAAAAALPQSAR